MSKQEVLLTTELKGLKLFKRGKVRDVYDLGDSLLIISTDRISCFDVILPNGIPDKGKVLTRLSTFWFDFIKDLTPHHLITSEVNQFPKELQPYKAMLKDRSMLVKKTQPIAIECVVRGYLSGSGWKDYKATGTIGGIKLSPGLKESEKLPAPIFSPASKEDQGHDINVTEKEVTNLIGQDMTLKLKEISLSIYEKASRYALSKGIIIADTKFEFGLLNNEIILIDEVLTPDSSRFWPRDGYAPGRPQPSFDKQFVRDYLEGLDWDKTPPAPALPEEIIRKTREKYLQALSLLTGQKL